RSAITNRSILEMSASSSSPLTFGFVFGAHQSNPIPTVASARTTVASAMNFVRFTRSGDNTNRAQTRVCEFGHVLPRAHLIFQATQGRQMRVVPEGFLKISPAFQCRVRVAKHTKSRKGRLKTSAVPSGFDILIF